MGSGGFAGGEEGSRRVLEVLRKAAPKLSVAVEFFFSPRFLSAHQPRIHCNLRKFKQPD
jgi:hypothetical protein